MPRQHGLLGILIALTLVILMTGTAIAEGDAKLNINTASVEELVQLDRVGQRYAERIVAYREQNGPFKLPEDIMQVAGIGPKTFEANKDRIVVK
jgi:competence protein ComEA